MTIEEEIFNNYKIIKDNLIKYGFKKENNKLILKKNILDNKFMIVFEYDKTIKGKIIELDFNEEYTNFRRESVGTFNSKVKDEFINCLIDIRNKCAIKDTFIFEQTKRINNYIVNKYNTNPEFLWEKYPSYAIYRKIKKWFALIGNVELNKVDNLSDDNKVVEIINLKINEEKLDDILKIKGCYKAYHMNKKKWITIILDDTLSDDKVKDMIDISFNNVKE